MTDAEALAYVVIAAKLMGLPKTTINQLLGEMDFWMREKTGAEAVKLAQILPYETK